MTRSPEGFIQWCREHPTDSAIPGASWDQKCASLVFRAGGFWSSFTSAYKAGLYTRNAHGLDSTKNPPLGWFPYFDIGGVGNGHIGMSLAGGSFLNANWRAHPMSPQHKALGVLGIQEYIDASGATYMGASPYFGDATLDLTSVAESGTPIGVDMPLDAADQAFIRTTIDGAARQVINEIQGKGQYGGANSLSVDGLRKDLGYLHTGAEDSLAAIFAQSAKVIDYDLLASKFLAGIGPSVGGLTKADVVDAIKSMSFKAS